LIPHRDSTKSGVRNNQRLFLMAFTATIFAAANTGYAAKRSPATTPAPPVITTTVKPVISPK
jgi:hypothetical protein